jgi:thymidylate synthase (FAD)
MDVNEKIKVLDHGYVQVVNFVGNDNLSLEAARMSTGNATGVDEAKDDHLRARLWSHSHTSPFEMASMCVELQLPIFVLRQIDRHRTTLVTDGEMELVFTSYDDFRKYTSRNEFSARYSEMPDLFYLPSEERIRLAGKSKTNKQGSGEVLEVNPEHVRDRLLAAYANARLDYEWLLSEGVASELARAVLPVAQYTKIRLQSSMLNWFRFLQLRLPTEAQWETRQFAKAIGRACRQLWPKSWETFEQHTLYAKTFSANERLALLQLLEAEELDQGSLVDALKPFMSDAKERTAFAKKLMPELGEEKNLLLDD